ncbi:WXG100 family type VII secretion target [Nocardia wallacei]|uniref:WXG100 family type VII secretion target n=1 Tax=Nocardia wallacei TaxID=480035 RepID=UPI0024575BA0|nr:WXG100 family type VII secretion target [Nocardia wallacei]
MSGELRVEVDRLRDASRFISEKAQLIRDGLKQLDDTVGKELLADGWQGKAASAYDESWVEWKQGAEAIIAALKDSSTKLAYAANEYETHDVERRDGIAAAERQV